MNLSPQDEDLIFGIDFDAACMALGMDAEKQIRESMDSNNRVNSFTRTLGQ